MEMAVASEAEPSTRQDGDCFCCKERRSYHRQDLIDEHGFIKDWVSTRDKRYSTCSNLLVERCSELVEVLVEIMKRRSRYAGQVIIYRAVKIIYYCNNPNVT